MGDDIANVQSSLLGEASTVTGKDLSVALHKQVHRWRYANIGKQSGPAYFMDFDRTLAAGGDWCVRGRIEAAFTSANTLASALLDRL